MAKVPANQKMIATHLPRGFKRKLEHLAVQLDKTHRELIADALNAYFRDHGMAPEPLHDEAATELRAGPTEISAASPKKSPRVLEIEVNESIDAHVSGNASTSHRGGKAPSLTLDAELKGVLDAIATGMPVSSSDSSPLRTLIRTGLVKALLVKANGNDFYSSRFEITDAGREFL